MIEFEDMERAVRGARAILTEHDISTSDYVHLDSDSRLLIERMASGWTDRHGIPRSRVVLRDTLVGFVEMGILIGVEIARNTAGQS